MWFEILPSAGIIAACMTVPHLFAYASHRTILGRPYRRTLKTDVDKHMFFRDSRIAGDAYNRRYLESIPDK